MRRSIALFLGAALVVSGCGRDQNPVTAAADSDATVPPDRPALTVEARGQTGRNDPAPGEVLLWVSNQSFEDDTVSVTITVDGQPAVADEFEVESQHNWIGFYLRGLAPGEHQVSARSDTGVGFDGSFTLPADEPRWLVLDYWFDRDDPGGRRFTFEEFDHAVMFM